MPYHTERLADAPIIVHTHETGPNLAAEIAEAMQGIGAMLNAEPGPVYLIINLGDLTMGIDDLLKTSSNATRGPGAILHHPNVVESLFVVTNRLLKMSIMGLTHEVFGSARVATFDTLDQALDFCYQRIAEEAQR